jgi:hypothetical protein
VPLFCSCALWMSFSLVLFFLACAPSRRPTSTRVLAKVCVFFGECSRVLIRSNILFHSFFFLFLFFFFCFTLPFFVLFSHEAVQINIEKHDRGGVLHRAAACGDVPGRPGWLCVVCSFLFIYPNNVII